MYQINICYSYFVIAASKDTEQSYRSPKELVHTEDIFYQWFYTNLDDSESDWEDLITFNTEDGDGSLPVVALNIPKDKNMKNFTLRVTARDWRVEWGGLANI